MHTHLYIHISLSPRGRAGAFGASPAFGAAGSRVTSMWASRGGCAIIMFVYIYIYIYT